MAARTKTTVVAAALATLTAWPLVHIYLVEHYGLSPWKLAGWGMYSAPRSRSLGMEVFGRPQGEGALVHFSDPTPAVREIAGRYLERHRWLRRLVRPDAFAAAIAIAHPEWDEVKIVVFEPDLDRTSGMVVMTVLVQRYGRTEGSTLSYASEEDPRAAGLPAEFLRQLGTE